MNGPQKWLWFGLAGVFLVLVLLLGSVYTVSEREVAVKLEFGNVKRGHTEPGLYFKIPFMQNVERYPKTLQFWRSNPQETLVDLPTADKKKIEVSAWAIWRITKPEKFRKVLVTVENAESAVKDRVRAAIRDEITSHSLSEVIRSTDRELTYSLLLAKPDAITKPDDNGNAPPDGSLIGAAPKTIQLGREQIMRAIRDSVQKRLQGESENDEDRGIELVDVGIYNISFVPAVREAAFDRLKAAMQAIAAKHENEGAMQKKFILNETLAEVERITGEGEGQSQAIRGTVDAEIIGDFAKAINETGDFYNFERQLELYKQSLKGKNSRLILTTDSEIFQLLKRLDKAKTPPQPDPPSEGESVADEVGETEAVE